MGSKGAGHTETRRETRGKKDAICPKLYCGGREKKVVRKG